MKILRAIRKWWNSQGKSLADLGYPSWESLLARGIDPKDFYLYIRFGIPLPTREGTITPAAPFVPPQPGEFCTNCGRRVE